MAQRQPQRQAQRKSRYAGIQAAGARDPYPNCGEYVLRVESMVESFNPGKGTDSVKVTFEVVESTGKEAQAPGDRVFVSERVSGPGSPAGLSRLKSLVMAAAGFDDEAEFDDFDEDGEFIEACLGASNKYSKDDRLAPGRLVAVRVSRGRDLPDGSDFYRNYDWSPIE